MIRGMIVMSSFGENREPETQSLLPGMN